MKAELWVGSRVASWVVEKAVKWAAMKVAWWAEKLVDLMVAGWAALWVVLSADWKVEYLD